MVFVCGFAELIFDPIVACIWTLIEALAVYVWDSFWISFGFGEVFALESYSPRGVREISTG